MNKHVILAAALVSTSIGAASAEPVSATTTFLVAFAAAAGNGLGQAAASRCEVRYPVHDVVVLGQKIGEVKTVEVFCK